MDSSLIAAIVSAVGAGVVSSLGTIAALRVHISYINETLKRHEKAIERAHQRADEHDKLLYHKV